MGSKKVRLSQQMEDELLDILADHEARARLDLTIWVNNHISNLPTYTIVETLAYFLMEFLDKTIDDSSGTHNRDTAAKILKEWVDIIILHKKKLDITSPNKTDLN